MIRDLRLRKDVTDWCEAIGKIGRSSIVRNPSEFARIVSDRRLSVLRFLLRVQLEIDFDVVVIAFD